MNWKDFFGDCSAIDSYLVTKPIYSWKWFIFHFINVLLRSVGQVVFCNNPISGLCILIACFVPDYKIGLATFLAGSTATLSEMFLQLGPWSAMRAGLTPLNSILIGCVISSLYPIEMDAKMWIFIGIGSFVSVFICAALSNTIGKIKIPYMTLPFNFVALSTFLVLTQSPKNEENVEKIIHTEIDWSQVGRGISVSMAQVYAINNIPASILMNFGVFLTSPLLLIMSFFGAALGSLVGVLLLPLEDIQEVYDGIWGYSAILSSCVICVFFAFNHVSFLLATVNILGTALIQYGLKLTLSLHNGVPFFTFPFCLSTMLFINVMDERGYLYRIESFSFPEKQTFEWFTKWKTPKTEPDVNNTTEMSKNV